MIKAYLTSQQASRIKLICGLGNPHDHTNQTKPHWSSSFYTRHDMGFMVVDMLCDLLGIQGYCKQQSGALLHSYSLPVTSGTQDILLVKPQSFMNTSGGPLSKIMREYRIKPNEVLVIHDELELGPDTASFKFGGGLHAHNGLRSDADKLQTHDFARLMVGIGRPPGRMKVADYVLRELKKQDLLNAQLLAQESACAIKDFLKN